jgi:phosphoketolase
MILNGRRIDQRSSIEQEGGERWFERHLRLNGFDPIGLDGRDPASIAWGILEIEARLEARAASTDELEARLGYGIVEAPKGYGFPGAGTNRAHNLPLPANPAHDAEARRIFNEASRRLWVPAAELDAVVAILGIHAAQQRPLERDNVFATRDVKAPTFPEFAWHQAGETASPMAALDAAFLAIVRANPQLRPRVGNPDELRSNKLDHTLDALKHRVERPETGASESTTGAVVTALNEEAVACAALGNKGGINLVVTYEAFAVKMLGALRQEIIFARHLREAGRPPGWLSVPFVLTSHTWENGKNEQSHQDPTLAEALLGEMADSVRVLFPIDANSAIALLRGVYDDHGRLAALVVPKRPLPCFLSMAEAERLASDGATVIAGDVEHADVLLVCCGAYQAGAALRARARLAENDVEAVVIAIAEPGRLRTPRDELERAATWSDGEIPKLFPGEIPRVIVTHTRPEPMLGALRRLDTGSATTLALGYRNRGGTFDVESMLFANRCTWAHIVEAAAQLVGRALGDFLTPDQIAAVRGEAAAGSLR